MNANKPRTCDNCLNKASDGCYKTTIESYPNCWKDRNQVYIHSNCKSCGIMSNEEKARSIMADFPNDHTEASEEMYDVFIERLVEMAEWKDEQFAKEKKDVFGIENVNFTEIDEDDDRFEQFKSQRSERGFDDSETWSLDVTICKFILPRLKAFQENKFGRPACMTEEQWSIIIDKMIFWLENYISDEHPQYKTEEYDIWSKKMDEGKKLFFDNFEDLWW